MELHSYNFDAMNETDIREEIVAPLLRHLGYRTGSEHNVLREVHQTQYLKYPRFHHGRKKSSDPEVTGRADYICTAGRDLNWVIEAKPPTQPLNVDDEQQAWTCANHSEVRAVYFVLTNGREFQVFQTDRKPGTRAVFWSTYEELRDNRNKLAELEGLLKPEAMMRRHPPDSGTGLPIGIGLRSKATISHGVIRIDEVIPDVPAIVGTIMTITLGAIERAEDGTLFAVCRTQANHHSYQVINEQLGLDRMQLRSQDSALSSNPKDPTVFEGAIHTVIPLGAQMMDPTSHQYVEAPFEMPLSVVFRISGTLSEYVFSGRYQSAIRTHDTPLVINAVSNGHFNVHLA